MHMNGSSDGGKKNRNEKGDNNMAMIKENADKLDKRKISRQELRKKLIRKTLEKNRTALEKLSKT